MRKNVTGLFDAVMNRPYSGDDDDKVIIQKNTYVLERLGLNIGEFCFYWDKFGPYSIELRDAVQYEMDNYTDGEKKHRYSEFIESRITMVQSVLHEGDKLHVDIRSWLEIVCSLHYLKNYVPLDNDILTELEKRKPNYNNRDINSKALEIINIIDSTGCYDGMGDDSSN